MPCDVTRPKALSQAKPRNDPKETYFQNIMMEQNGKWDEKEKSKTVIFRFCHLASLVSWHQHIYHIFASNVSGNFVNRNGTKKGEKGNDTLGFIVGLMSFTFNTLKYLGL